MSTLTTNRDGSGRFLPGHSQAGPGRPPRSQEEAMLATIKASMPPDRIVEIIEKALALAEETRSWRGYLAVLEFAAAYSLGKPSTRVEPEENDQLEVFLARLRQG